MKITIYELLGLIKDGKQPTKIKYEGNIYEYKDIEEGIGYVHEYKDQDIPNLWFSDIMFADDIYYLNKFVEIIEDKEIKKISPCYYDDEEFSEQHQITIAFNKINELIDVVNELRNSNGQK